MLSFHNDPGIKDKYLSRVRHHREMDNIIQGTGWKNGKGCAVGCTLENYDHSRYPIELGLPEWLAHLEDNIFEKLDKKEAILWPELFLKSIPVGVDVNYVKNKISIHRIDRLIIIQNKNYIKFPELKEVFIETIRALEVVKKCHESELNKSYCNWEAAQSAARKAAQLAERKSAQLATWSSVWSAAYSAYSAAAAASAYSAYSAYSAASASAAAAASAYSAYSAYSAASASAADSAASAESEVSEAWKKEANTLLKLLSECK